MPYFKGICSAVCTLKRLSERGVDTLEALRRTDVLGAMAGSRSSLVDIIYSIYPPQIFCLSAGRQYAQTVPLS